MAGKRISVSVLMDRLETLQQRYGRINTRIAEAQNEAQPQLADVQQLKREQLGLKHAIKVTEAVLARVRSKSASYG